MTDESSELRTTRFVCVSDTHNTVPGGAFKLPKGDILIHAGDLTNQGSFSELQKTVQWIEKAAFEVKIVVAGNHDITLDAGFYMQYGSSFHNQSPQDIAKCHALLARSSSITWLNHETSTIKLTSPNGPRTTFSVFGSPFSPAKGTWAFGYEPGEAVDLWNQIPLGTDIVVTHTPPKNHCDQRKDDISLGCEALRQKLWRVRPKLAVCGHCHESRGAERVRWDMRESHQASIGQKWDDPARNATQISLVDLTVKGGDPLMNIGAKGDCERAARSALPIDVAGTLAKEFHGNPSPTAPALTEIIDNQDRVLASPELELEAMSGSPSRRETCIVNAAIMATSWPHHGGKRFNKPIVVDIDLPVWHLQ